MSDFPYGTTVVSGHRYVSLLSRSCDDQERIFQVWFNGTDRGRLSIPSYYVPGIAISATHVAIWAGKRVFLYPLTSGSSRSLDLKHEIHVAYPIEDRWCFVCELSVIIFDEDRWAELAHYDHDEVLGRSQWSADQLLVEDFQGRCLVFHPKSDPLDLTPVVGRSAS